MKTVTLKQELQNGNFPNPDNKYQTFLPQNLKKNNRKHVYKAPNQLWQ